MFFAELFANYSTFTIISLAFFCLVAGFLDAVVGGGGLITIPTLLINFPNSSLPTLFGTNKIAALSGTSVSAYHYSKKIKFNYLLLFTIAAVAGAASFCGARVVSRLDTEMLKPMILIILMVIAIYTFLKKDLGSVHTKALPLKKQLLTGALLGLGCGFYDGFFGPGTGSFLVMGFVVMLGFDFLSASAYSKIINCFTNLSALTVFIRQGNYIIEIAILMSVCMIIGNFAGTKVALRRGSGFVRTIFLIIVLIMIVRYAYDVFGT
ncbi:MAG TPA: TSUP family transporter [Flavobacterium sp.]|nr:TSUP family transporter [Flavobacterium sp.]